MTLSVVKKLLIGAMVLSASATVAGTTFAQEQAQSNFRNTGWFKACGEVGENTVCNVQFRIIAAQNNQPVVSVNLIEPQGEGLRSLFRVVVPTARALRSGISLVVDGKRGATIPYLFCRPTSCSAEIGLNEDLVKVFKGGGKLDIVTEDFRGQQNVFPVTLKGFTAAYDGDPIKPEDPQQSQLKLQEQLKQKAEELKQQ